MRDINKIIIHCSDSPQGRGDDINTIREWHLERGFKDVGYHYVILENGDVQKGREHSIAGAHAKGFNSKSLGICLIGIDSFTEEQYESLAVLIKKLMLKYEINEKNVLGHYMVSDSKTCPNFNVCEFMYNRVRNK
jgi:N-acetylmuramoyl-L-alanine amidase